MPSVASDPPALKPVAPLAPRPAAAPVSDGAPASPFESLLEATQPAPEPPPASPRSDTPPPARTDSSPPPAQSNDNPPPKSDDGAQADAAAKPAETGKTAKPAQAPDAKTDGKPASDAKSTVDTALTLADAPAQTDQTGDSSKTADAKADGKAKTDAKTATQGAAEDGLKTPGKDKPDDSAQTPDDAPANAAGQAPAATGANVVATVVAPVTTPVTLTAGKPAAKDLGIAADDAPKTQQNVLASLQAAGAKPADDAKAADKTAAPSGGKPQPASGAPDKQPDTQAPAAAPADHRSADAQAPLNTGTHVDAAKTADANPPPVPVQPQNAAPASTAPAPAPAPQALPQAAAIPLSGVAIDIAGKALAGKNRFEIRLDPPELGRIEVRLDVDKDGRVTSHVIADNKDTLNLLQRDASGLQRAFQDAGLKTSDNGLQFSLRDQSSGQQQQQNPGAANPNTPQLVVEDDAPIDAMPSGYGRLIGLSGGLDIRV